MLDRRLLGWGLFFILVGAIPLATRAGLLDPAVVGRWPSLWPLLLVAWGVGLLLRRTPLEWIGGALSVIVFGVMGGGVLATGFGGVPDMTGCGGNDPGTVFGEASGNLGSPARVNVEFDCGTVAVQTADGTAWNVLWDDRDGRGPQVEANDSLATIRSRGEANLFASGGHAWWTVTLPRSPLLAVGLTLNAGDGSVDLTGATISSLSLTLNAGSLTVNLANATQAGDVNATVNAGSATLALPGGARSANLSLNAGSLDVCLPPGTPVRVHWSGALGSNDFDEIGLIRVDDSTWTSAGFDASQPHLELHVSANAGSFGLDLGGTCDA